ncbi:MAG: S8 family peptidase [Chitinophagaceae bacterium]
MSVTREQFQELIFNGFSHNIRFTQDSPVYPDVWLEYFDHRNDIDNYRADLILLPHRQSSAAELFKTLQETLNKSRKSSKVNEWQMASNGETVAACLTLEELVNIALPLTNWWQKYLWKDEKETPDQRWIQEVVGAIYNQGKEWTVIDRGDEKFSKELRTTYDKHFEKIKPDEKYPRILLWSVSRNRKASISIEKSVPATKADATRRLFDIDGSDVTWAVLDTGIDASHQAFRKTDPVKATYFPKAFGSIKDPLSNHTRVIATYDFSNFRNLLSDINNHGSLSDKSNLLNKLTNTSDKDDKKLSSTEIGEFINETERDLKNGRMLDWSVISPLLRIPHNDKEYRPPVHSHGTHVAGILGAGFKGTATDKALLGMCPGINLYDIRVLDAAGAGNEFNILAAIQFVRWMNNQKDGLVIHGINLSLSMNHEVASYACVQTPVCDACERLVAEGTIVVAAAGNLGQTMYQDKDGVSSQGFRMVNITDPGNAENVITVGATHRDRPFSYGVSYFSSKGPTGDGRIKPDLVAPGEKIVSSFVGDNKTDRLDGTSMAAPHVSGAAALLISKHKELTGRPKRVKEILCKTATDLGREKYFQGCGMLDVLRALQSV